MGLGAEWSLSRPSQETEEKNSTGTSTQDRNTVVLPRAPCQQQCPPCGNCGDPSLLLSLTLQTLGGLLVEHAQLCTAL